MKKKKQIKIYCFCITTQNGIYMVIVEILSTDYMGQFPRILPLAYIGYKISLHLDYYNFRTVKAIDFLLSTLNTTSFLYCKIHFRISLAPCQYCNVRYPFGFKLAITFDRSNQIDSNSVSR